MDREIEKHREVKLVRNSREHDNVRIYITQKVSSVTVDTRSYFTTLNSNAWTLGTKGRITLFWTYVYTYM